MGTSLLRGPFSFASGATWVLLSEPSFSGSSDRWGRNWLKLCRNRLREGALHVHQWLEVLGKFRQFTPKTHFGLAYPEYFCQLNSAKSRRPSASPVQDQPRCPEDLVREKPENRDDCGRQPGPKECALSSLGLDPIETQILDITRHVFQSYAAPNTQAWLNGLAYARRAFGYSGPQAFALVVDVLQAVRTSRTSCFIFNSPTCPCCAGVVTEHERRLILAFAAIRRGEVGRVRTELMMLCEGAPTGAVIRALIALSGHLATPDAKQDTKRVLQ